MYKTPKTYNSIYIIYTSIYVVGNDDNLRNYDYLLGNYNNS